jgi:hypothetical protein
MSLQKNEVVPTMVELVVSCKDLPIEIVPPRKGYSPRAAAYRRPLHTGSQKNQPVAFGQMIGKGEAFISASLHAP